jgi:hypothetical protein
MNGGKSGIKDRDSQMHVLWRVRESEETIQREREYT